jgi:hypothetical protein
MAQDAELERCFARYQALKESKLADDEDLGWVRETLLGVTTDPLTHQPYPPRDRLRVLQKFNRFEPEVVLRAVWRYRDVDGGNNGKGHKYLLSICEGGATSETIEKRRARERREEQPNEQSRRREREKHDANLAAEHIEA